MFNNYIIQKSAFSMDKVNSMREWIEENILACFCSGKYTDNEHHSIKGIEEKL